MPLPTLVSRAGAKVVRRVVLTLALACGGLWTSAELFGTTIESALMSLVMPKFNPLRERMAIIEAAQHYRLPSDPTLSAIEAGEMFHRLQNGTALASPGYDRGELRALAPEYNSFAEKAALTRDAYATLSNPHAEALMKDPREKSKLNEALALYPRQAQLADGTDLISRLARAERMDLPATRLDLKKLEGVNIYSYPFGKFGPLKEAAYARTAQIAWDIEDGNLERAEQSAKELYSLGYVFHENAYQMIDGLIGALIAGVGLNALEAVYRAKGNMDEVARIEAARKTKPLPIYEGENEKAEIYDPEQVLRSVVNREDISLGMKWEYLGMTLFKRSCGDFPLVSIGEDLYEEIEPAFSHTEGHRALFRTATEAQPPVRSILDWPAAMKNCIAMMEPM